MLPQTATAAGRGAAGAPWAKLRREVGDALMPLHFPLADCTSAGACEALFKSLQNPYLIGENPGLTQTLGWAGAWKTMPSRYAVAARNAHDVAAAVNFAREYGVRIAVRGGAHSYLGTSNAADSLLIWTRPMHDVALHGDSVSLGAGTIWKNAYTAVTTQNGRYVQGGGCTTVGVAGLIQSGGFGSFSKHYGMAASWLTEAEVVTADGRIRTVNAQNDPDLFWAFKGGGGGTFGVVTRLTLRMHDLPANFGAAAMRVKASSDAAYLRLVRRFIAFYRDALFNEHWGEQVSFHRDNTLRVSLVFAALDQAQAQAAWKPFLDWVRSNARDYSFEQQPIIIAIPARNWWNASFLQSMAPGVVTVDPRSGHQSDWWWAGDGEQAGQYLYGYQSLWLPALLLSDDAQPRLVQAIYDASRQYGFSLHCNKGLAGAPPAAIDAAKNTAMNPNVTQAFALAICADGEGPAYPGIPGHEPNLGDATLAGHGIEACMSVLRGVAPGGGSYVSESNYFEPQYGRSYWGANYPRLAAIKRRYDPHNLFAVRNGVTPAR